ncbi:hypothetical protein E2542_SST28056 [Spatholobus suberectus]|nr:hypothetical protein E2542_SST28056 [Spatholobus suberectus]
MMGLRHRATNHQPSPLREPQPSPYHCCAPPPTTVTSKRHHRSTNRHIRRDMTRPLYLRCTNSRVPPSCHHHIVAVPMCGIFNLHAGGALAEVSPPFCHRCAWMGKSPL